MNKLFFILLLIPNFLFAASDTTSLFGVTESTTSDRAVLAIVGSIELSTSSYTKKDPSIIANARVRRLTVSDENRVNVATMTQNGFYGNVIEVSTVTITHLTVSSITATGSVAANTFIGDGNNLTNLDSDELDGTIPTGLIDLSTVTTALALKLDNDGDGASVTNLTAANISAGSLDGDVIVSSIAIGAIDNTNILAQMGCGDDEILKINGTTWNCEVEGGAGFVTEAGDNTFTGTNSFADTVTISTTANFTDGTSTTTFSGWIDIGLEYKSATITSGNNVYSPACSAGYRLLSCNTGSGAGVSAYVLRVGPLNGTSATQCDCYWTGANGNGLTCIGICARVK